MNSDWREGLFEYFEELIDLEICCKSVQVPENNKLLRCFQFIKMDTVSVGEYCWNGECTNCQIWYKSESGETKAALACKMYARPGLVITRLSEHLQGDLLDES